MPNDRLDVDSAKRELANIDVTRPELAAGALKQLQGLAEKLECTVNPDHSNVMLYSGYLSGDRTNFHELAGMKNANALAEHFSDRYVEKDANGRLTDGVSIIDHTDRAKFLGSSEFMEKRDAIVKLSMGADASDSAKVRTEINKVSLENPDAFWKVASADFATSAQGRNLFSVIPEADVARVFGTAEMGAIVSEKNANQMHGMPIDKFVEMHADKGSTAVFDKLKEDSRETLGYMFTKVEVSQVDGKLELKPVITKEALEHMGYTAIKDFNAPAVPEAAIEGGFQGLKGVTGPAALAGVKELNELTAKLQAGASMAPGTAAADVRKAQLGALGGETKKTNLNLPRDVIGSATGNVQPIKPFNGTVMPGQHRLGGSNDTVTVKVDAAQSRLKQVDFKRSEHPELDKAAPGDWVHCEVKNGKLEPQLIKAVGAAGQMLEAAKQLKGPAGPGLAGTAVDASAHASVTLGQHRAVPSGRGGR